MALQTRFPRVIPPLWIENLWIRLQGPYCPALIEYLKRHQGDYDAFLFYTYLYYPTVIGLPLVADRSILIPTAHDERAIYLRMYRRLFGSASGLIYLTPEEQAFTNQLFGLWNKPQQVASMHIPTLDELSGCTTDPPVGDILAAKAIKQPYLLYLGRLDMGKGVDKMFGFFSRYLEEQKREGLLVLAGDRQADVPDSASILNLGFLSEKEKRAAILGSKALVLLSPHESFSIAVLEAMGLGRPVIVTAESPVLKGHVERSGSGFAVSSYEEFRAAMNAVFAGGEEPDRPGIRYVKENYSWEKVESAYLNMIEKLTSG